MPRTSRLLALLLAPAALAFAAGCGGDTPTGPRPAAVAGPDQAPAAKAPEAPQGSEHAHKPGGHGGNVVEIGRDNYHAEAVFEPGGLVRVYLLGRDEARVLEVEA